MEGKKKCEKGKEEEEGREKEGKGRSIPYK